MNYPQSFLASPEHFIIDGYVEFNIYYGRLQCGGRFTPVTILFFPRLMDAVRQIDFLRLFNDSPIIATGYKIAKDGGVGGYAIVEPLRRFSAWTSQERKDGMWKYDSNSTNCLGVGTEFQRIFGAIGYGLLTINTAGVAHGNLNAEGVMLDSNFKIRLLNLDCRVETLQSVDLIHRMRKDLYDFRTLIMDAANLDVPHPSYPNHQIWHDLYHFDGLYTAVPDFYERPSDFVDNVSRWIYRSFLFWNGIQVYRFVENMNQLMEFSVKELSSAGFLASFSDWETVVQHHPDHRMDQCRRHQPTTIYNEAFGVLRFGRNYHEHPNAKGKLKSDSDYRGSPDSFGQFLETFPVVVGMAYYHVFTKMKDVRILKGPPQVRYHTFGQYFWNASSDSESVFKIERSL